VQHFVQSMAPKGWVKGPDGHFVPPEFLYPGGLVPKKKQPRDATPPPLFAGSGAQGSAPQLAPQPQQQVVQPQIEQPQQQPPPPKAKAKASKGEEAVAPAGSKRRKQGSWWKTMGKLCSTKPLWRISTWIGLVTLMALYKGQSGPIEHFSRILGSLADVTVATSSVASFILNQTNQLASSTSSAVQAASTSSLSIAEAAWRGVDLQQLSGLHVTGKVVVDDPEIFAVWLHSPAGQAVTKCSEEMLLEQWVAAARSISPSMNYVEASDRWLNVSGVFTEGLASAQLLWTGQLAVHFHYLHVSFHAGWANPFWDLLEYHVETESAQILEMLSRFAQTVPSYNVSWGQLSEASLRDIPPEVLQQGRYRRHLRKISLEGAAWLSILNTKGGMGFAVVSLFCLGLYLTACSPSFLGAWLRQSLRVCITTGMKYTEWAWDFGFELIP
jgi:hypothetical protein